MSVLNFLKSLVGGEAGPETLRTRPGPDEPFYAIGDIHGRADLVERLFALIEAHAGKAGHPDAPVVFVGDYVDRGDESAAVLRMLHQKMTETPGLVHCLMGNHERMMLDFIEMPEEAGRRWLRNGGLQTLASFGIGGVTESAAAEALEQAARAFEESVGADLLGWVASRPLTWQSGNVTVLHAAADPDVPMAEQFDHTLLWGDPEFLRRPREDGAWVIHGHTIFDAPQLTETRISIDTGAYYSGTLTAVCVLPDGSTEFLDTRHQRVA